MTVEVRFLYLMLLAQPAPTLVVKSKFLKDNDHYKNTPTESNLDTRMKEGQAALFIKYYNICQILCQLLLHNDLI